MQFPSVILNLLLFPSSIHPRPLHPFDPGIHRHGHHLRAEGEPFGGDGRDGEPHSGGAFEPARGGRSRFVDAQRHQNRASGMRG